MTKRVLGLLILLLVTAPGPSSARHVPLMRVDAIHADPEILPIYCSGANVGVNGNQVLLLTAAHCIQNRKVTVQPLTNGTTAALVTAAPATVVRISGELALLSYTPTGRYDLHIVRRFADPIRGHALLSCGAIYEEGTDDQSVCLPGSWAGEIYNWGGIRYHVAVVPVRRGMSGGPVFDNKGYLIGIVVFTPMAGTTGVQDINSLLPFIPHLDN